jgi:sugar phosphate isomerase/epimerase
LRGALEEVLPLADDLDVDLAIEPMHPGCAADWTFLTSIGDAMELLTAINSPRLKLAFDTYHLCQDGAALAMLPQIASRIAIVQLGDAQQPPQGEPNRARLGQGRLPLAAAVQALERAGYSGYYDVEIIGEQVEQTCYKELIAQSKQAFAKLLEA